VYDDVLLILNQSLNFSCNFFSNILVLINPFDIDIKEFPLFIFGGILFFLTVSTSFFNISYLGLYGVFYINLFSLWVFWLTLLPYIYVMFNKNFCYKLVLCQWFFLNHGVKVDFELLIDTLSFSFMLLTTTIGLFVYMYAFSYFRYEPLVDRFLLFLCSFILSMLLLVSAGNIIILFLGWELIGLTSFF